MFKLRNVAMAAAIGLGAFTSGATAATMDAPVPSNLIVSASGFEWAWAAPCSPTGCNGDSNQSSLDLSFQGGLGWRLPSIAEMTAAVVGSGGSALWAALFDDGAKCAEAYFTNSYFSHCDGSDAINGYIHNLDGAPDANPNEETFVLREVAPIPVPAAGFLLVGALGGLAALRRRRKS